MLEVEKSKQELMVINSQKTLKALELEEFGGGFDATLHDLSAKDQLVKEEKIASKPSLEKSQHFQLLHKVPNKVMSKVPTPHIDKEGVVMVKELQLIGGGTKVGAKPTLEEDPQSMELDEVPNDEPKVSICETKEEGVPKSEDAQVCALEEVKQLGDAPTLKEASGFIMLEGAPIEKFEEVGALKIKNVLQQEPQFNIFEGEKRVEVKQSSKEEKNSLKPHKPPIVELVKKVVQEAFEIPLTEKEKHMGVVPLEEHPLSMEFYDALSDPLEDDPLMVDEANQHTMLEWAPIEEIGEAPILVSSQGTILKSKELQLYIGDEETDVVAKSSVEETPQSLKFHEVSIEELEKKVVLKAVKFPLLKEERHAEVELAMEKKPWSTKLEKALNEHAEPFILETEGMHLQKLEKAQVPILNQEKEVVCEPKLQITPQSNILVDVSIEKPKEVLARELPNEEDILKQEESQLGVVKEGNVFMRLVGIHHLVKEGKHFQVEPCLEGLQSTKLDEAFSEHAKMIPKLDPTKLHPFEILSKDDVQKIEEAQMPIVKQEKQVGDDLMLDVGAPQSNMLGETPTKCPKGMLSMEMKEDVSKLDMFKLGVGDELLEEDIGIESSLKQAPQIKKLDMEVVLPATTIPCVQEGNHVEVEPLLKTELMKELVDKMDECESTLQMALQLIAFDGTNIDEPGSMIHDEEKEKNKVALQLPLEEPQSTVVFDDVIKFKVSNIHGTKEHILLKSNEHQNPIDEGEKEFEVEPILTKGPQSRTIHDGPIQDVDEEVNLEISKMLSIEEEKEVVLEPIMEETLQLTMFDKTTLEEPKDALEEKNQKTILDEAPIDKLKVATQNSLESIIGKVEKHQLHITKDEKEAGIQPVVLEKTSESMILDEVSTQEVKEKVCYSPKQIIEIGRTPMQKDGMQTLPMCMESTTSSINGETMERKIGDIFLETTMPIEMKEISNDLSSKVSSTIANEVPSMIDAIHRDPSTYPENMTQLQTYEGPWEVDQTWEQFKRNWKISRTKPNSLIISKVHQARKIAKEKAYKVVGLPWPPTCLYTPLDLKEEKR